MVSPKKLIKIARKWQNLVVIRRKIISFPRNNVNGELDSFGTPFLAVGTPFLADKGQFVVYSDDGRRFVIPLVFLNNEVLRQLLKMSEEEFGLPGDGPITLPCDVFLVEYTISLIRRGVADDLEKALLTSVCRSRCTSNQDIMINSKKLIKMARKWQRVAAIRRKIISLSGSSASVTDKGHFVVYSTDRKRYVFPLVYLNSYIFRELLKVSEEEYGLPTDGPIVFPCDAVFVEYAIALIQKRTTQDVEKSLLMSIVNRCSSSYSLHQQETNQRLLVCDIMISTKTLAKMVKKWQNLVAIRRKRISFPRNSSDAPPATDKGHFVVYSEDGRRFVIPLVYLNNEVLIQLLKMSEEEFGLPGNGPITLPCDAFFMEFIISLLRRGVAEDLEKVLLMSVCQGRCELSFSHQGQTNQQLLLQAHSVSQLQKPCALD
ncbi:hypothetical protein RJ640_024949 [Escallonia rubra]|uniref:Uncharacterized protein n=1 Tax=Escallonia rubra TaxID=112253 RepID=A0AA88R3T3_9ASTE|nr:hypothetical protein RJ640_024949 [Escallonia rubra]